jgi:hypothetical protein
MFDFIIRCNDLVLIQNLVKFLAKLCQTFGGFQQEKEGVSM